MGIDAAAKREIRTALCTIPMSDHGLARLRAALAPAELILCSDTDRPEMSRRLADVDAAFVAGSLDGCTIPRGPLRWVHSQLSGLEKLARSDLIDQGILVSGSAGRSAPALAQHVFFFVLSLLYDAAGLLEMQRQRQWRKPVGFSDRTSLTGRTIGIIGVGNVGIEVATIAKAFGMRVLGYARQARETPASVDRLFCAARGETLDELLAESDFVVVACRLTDETRRMVGRREIALMRQDAYLINIARGEIVDQAALIDALEDSLIAGAGLDVFEIEPIPHDDPVWNALNLMITPHATLRMQNFEERTLDTLIENIRRYRDGLPLQNALGVDDIYSSAGARRARAPVQRA